jgi:hypothetical protein
VLLALSDETFGSPVAALDLCWDARLSPRRVKPAVVDKEYHGPNGHLVWSWTAQRHADWL